MKKRIFTLLLAFISITIMAQDGGFEFYGDFSLEYNFDDNTDEDNLGAFGLDGASIGTIWTVSDKIKVNFEAETAGGFDLSTAEVIWSVSEAFTLTGGRSSEVFAPNSDWYGESYEGIGASYAASIAVISFQAGNDVDSAPSALTLMPAVVVTPDLGDVTFETGVNAKLLSGTTEWAQFYNVYASLEVSDLAALVSMDFNSIQDSDSSDMDLYADGSYTIATVTPGVSFYLDDLASNTQDLETSVDLYTSVAAHENLSFIATVSLENISKANGGELTTSYTLALEWTPSFTY